MIKRIQSIQRLKKNDIIALFQHLPIDERCDLISNVCVDNIETITHNLDMNTLQEILYHSSVSNVELCMTRSKKKKNGETFTQEEDNTPLHTTNNPDKVEAGCDDSEYYCEDGLPRRLT